MHTGRGPSLDGGEMQVDITVIHISPPRRGEHDQAGITSVAEESGNQEPSSIAWKNVKGWSQGGQGMASPQNGKHVVNI